MTDRRSHPAEPWAFAQGEMAGRIRAFDWASTPLGPLDSWPEALRTAAGILLGAPQPALIGWGPGRILLYNDACIPLLGPMHPRAMGRGSRDLWAATWEVFHAAADAAMKGSPGILADQAFPPAGGPRHRP
ncbi:MAG: hypothetical protein WD270_07155, partial [Acetobacterales bacterium]